MNIFLSSMPRQALDYMSLDTQVSVSISIDEENYFLLYP